MGRRKKLTGNIFEGLREGQRLRITCCLKKWHHVFLGKRAPRGQTGKTYRFTSFLKERVPLVYVFIVDELKKKDESKQDRRLVKILKEWKREQARERPSARELTAYIIERAMRGAWEAWGLKPPYSAQEHDNFYRRYVHGHEGAIRTFRQALRMPKPWEYHHVGRELRWFLGPPGKAARHYNLLEPKSLDVPVVTITEE